MLSCAKSVKITVYKQKQCHGRIHGFSEFFSKFTMETCAKWVIKAQLMTFTREGLAQLEILPLRAVQS
ncbi:MAG: hypothetical protein CMO78_06530 [Verrucomicrobiales bacterium]|nr:hypothetical protein [Verrucomicrobiales bacterium]